METLSRSYGDVMGGLGGILGGLGGNFATNVDSVKTKNNILALESKKIVYRLLELRDFG